MIHFFALLLNREECNAIYGNQLLTYQHIAMRRILVTLSVLLFWLPSLSQSRDALRLQERNAELQAVIDSLKMRIASLEADADPWSQLSGLDDEWTSGDVSSLDDSPDGLAWFIARSSPSLDIRYDSAIARHLSRYTGRNRRMMERALGRYARRYDYFRKVFASYGVPEELTALCIVESAVTSSAVSPAGAVGIWQIMPSTGRQYGLQVDEDVDERTDMEKSTDAAARILRDLHRKLGSWSLALMGYNCGGEAVRRAQIRAGGSTDPWEVLPYLPSETQAYLPAFLAVSYLTVYGESREGMKPR